MPVSVRSALGIAALAALLWTGAEIRSLTSAGTPLHRLPAAPHGGISLQLASSPEEAQAIRNAWACRGLDLPTPCEDVTPVARQALARDSRFIAAYSLAFILTILWSAGSTQPSRRFVLLLFGLLAIGVACDLVENWALATTLGFAGEMPVNGVMSMFPGWRGGAAGSRAVRPVRTGGDAGADGVDDQVRRAPARGGRDAGARRRRREAVPAGAPCGGRPRRRGSPTERAAEGGQQPRGDRGTAAAGERRHLPHPALARARCSANRGQPARPTSRACCSVPPM